MMQNGLQQVPIIAGCTRTDTDPIDKCLPCNEAPDPTAPTICARFGKKIFDSRVDTARTSIMTFATLRQNVLSARMWRLAGRTDHHERWMPRYSWAMRPVETMEVGDAKTKAMGLELGLLALRQLFPKLDIRILGASKPDDAPIDGYLTAGTYFARLSGHCDGISERAQLGISACKASKCDFVVDQNEQKRLHLRKVDGTWRQEGERSKDGACVMASMPSSYIFENGFLWQTEAGERLRALADRMATMLAFETTFSQLERASQKWRLLEAREAQLRMQTFLDFEGGNHAR